MFQDSPLVSIVTPSLNMGRFLEHTIESVFAQDYPHIEYRVMDGGSSDETISILERYSGRLQYESRTDNGAADAIRRGFERTRGDIIAYLNADDVYLPGAVSAAVYAFEQNPDVDVLYGDAVWIDEAGVQIGRYPTRDFDRSKLIRECFICQPAAFVKRSAYEAAGGIDPKLHYTFDYDLWLRVAREHRFLHLKQVLAESRMHTGNKTIGSRRKVLRETINTVRANAGFVGFGHVYAYACHLLDNRDQFFEPVKPSPLKYALAVALGLGLNRSAAGLFVREYLSGLHVGKRRTASSCEYIR